MEGADIDATTALLRDVESNNLNNTDSSSESWKNPKSNIIKVLIVFCGFTLLGLNDSAVGALLPSLEHDYKLNDLQASFTFLTPMSGSLVSALLSGWIHSKIGRGGVSILAALLQFACHLSASQNPPYPFYLAAMTCGGLANGLINGSWNAWMGAFDNAHGILGILHGFYALGGIVGPAVITFILKRENPWYTYYRFTATCQFFLLILIITFFRGDTAEVYNQKTGSQDYDAINSGKEPSHMDAFKSKIVWLLALLLCAYNGIELGLNGWLVTFMIRERHGDPKEMGLVSSSFWIGLTIGRVTLGFLTGRFRNQHRVVNYYFFSAIALFLCFSSVRSIILSGVFITGVGYFIGPIYPSTMILATSVLPKRLHVSGISAAAALSGSGSAVFPLMVGAFANTFGVEILIPIIGVYFVIITCLWALIVHNSKPPDR